MLRLEGIGAAMKAHPARTLPVAASAHAAVALVLRERAGAPELLFIERALRDGDPWSGHMAFPGGRMQAEDANARAAAERETLEEVGIALGPGEALGRLDDLEGRHAGRSFPLVVSAFVYRVAGPPSAIQTSDEVTEALWVPLARLFEPGRHTELRYRSGARTLLYPAIVVGQPPRHVVWGLTYRLLETFLAVAGRPLPDRWEGAL